MSVEGVLCGECCVDVCMEGVLCGCVYGGSAVWMCVWRECCVDVCMEGMLCGCVYGGSAVWMCLGECSVGNAVWMCVWREECCVDVCVCAFRWELSGNLAIFYY